MARIDLNLFQAAVLIEGHGCMIEQVVVVDAEHAAVGEQRADVLVKLLAYLEAVMKLVDEVELLVGEHIWMGRVNGGEVAAGELVLLAVKVDGTLLIVDIVEQLPVSHVPFRMFVKELGLEFELQH